MNILITVLAILLSVSHLSFSGTSHETLQVKHAEPVIVEVKQQILRLLLSILKEHGKQNAVWERAQQVYHRLRPV